MIFDYSLLHWTTFFTAAILLNLSPGPDIAFILGQTIRGGRRAGFVAMFGVWSGAFMHVLFAALGLSAIIAASATLFGIIKWIGALYLIWLGWQALRSGDTLHTSTGKTVPQNLNKIFRQGFLVATLNPKVALFFLAFLPQFVEPGAGSVAAQLFWHGILIIVVAGFVEPPLVLLGGRLTHYLRRNPHIARWIDRGLGTLFIVLGLRLAASDRI